MVFFNSVYNLSGVVTDLLFPLVIFDNFSQFYLLIRFFSKNLRASRLSRTFE